MTAHLPHLHSRSIVSWHLWASRWQPIVISVPVRGDRQGNHARGCGPEPTDRATSVRARARWGGPFPETPGNARDTARVNHSDTCILKDRLP